MTTTKVLRPFVTVKEAAEILNVTPGTVYKMCRAGIIKHSRVGATLNRRSQGHYRILLSDLDVFDAIGRDEPEFVQDEFGNTKGTHVYAEQVPGGKPKTPRVRKPKVTN